MPVSRSEMSSPGESEMLDGISRAFFAALDRDVGTFEIGVWCALGVAASWVVVSWIRGDAQSEQRERRELAQRRERILSEAPPRLERREWLRVSARVPMKTEAGMTETHDVSGGGVSFLSDRPPVQGTRLRLALDLGADKPVAVRGNVVRVSPPRQPNGPSLVAVKFSAIDASTQDRIVRWVVEEARREVVVARRGRLCASCERPLADGVEE